MEKTIRTCKVCGRPYVYELEKYPNADSYLCPICKQYEDDLYGEELNSLKDTSLEGDAKTKEDTSFQLFIKSPLSTSNIELKGETKTQ
jgi:hypothetical protein